MKVFGRWESHDIKIKDPGLERYLSVKPIIVPKTGARYAGYRFHKSKLHIVERLINRLMVPGHKGKKHKFTSGHVTGKGQSAYQTVYEALTIIENRTKKNPIEVLVRAVENAAPREEIITIEYGGARYPKAVECAPQRRIDIALRMMTQGAFQKSVKSKKSAAAALADEILAAFNLNPQSNAIAKKLELERQADGSR
ncbi:30S ribosomal protein S7 [Candidatus Woesearchaeota archaeon]|nr:MAG: 30S ribosomal protein S7 [Candidatus Woesearchaeota archaeon]